MKPLFLVVIVAFCVQFVHAQPEPVVAVDNITIRHEHKGWRVTSVSTTPIHYNLLKDDLIVRIDGKNAGDTGPMVMASLFNQGYRRAVHLFLERGGFGMETTVREIPVQDYAPVGANPFRHGASGFSVPDAELKDIDGQTWTFDQFKNKWLMIDFVGTWCAPCMSSMAETLSILSREHLSLLMIAVDDKQEAVRRMQQKYQIGAPIAMMKGTSQLAIDFGIATNRWSGQIPGYVLVGPDGEVALIAIGVDAKYLERMIQSLMASHTSESAAAF